MKTICLVGKPTSQDMNELEKFDSMLRAKAEFRRRGRSNGRAAMLALRFAYGAREYREMMSAKN